MDAVTKPALFRMEQLRHLKQRLHGEISIAVPVSWQLIGYFLFAVHSVAIVFLCAASYARVETVSGAVTLDKGVISIVPTRPGIVTELLVREGMPVGAGDPLLTIRSEENLPQGDTAPERILAALGEQDQSFEKQAALLTSAAEADQERILEQARGLSAEIKRLDAQISVQQRLIELSRNLYTRAQEIAAQGFISRHDRDASEVEMLAKRQQLYQLQQGRAAKAAELLATHRALEQTATNAQAQITGLSSSRAQVAQQVAQARSVQGYSLASPVAGTVTALTARVGQPATAAAPAMLVVPADAQPLVELYVPSSAIGFLAVGQDVRLNLDAFPYERFGIVAGRIESIATAAGLRTLPDGKSMPIYLVTASLPKPSIKGFGREQPLLAGMTLSARIVTRRQTLLEWLFEPLFSVSRR